MYKIKRSSYMQQTSNGVNISIIALTYFLVRTNVVFADGADGGITVLSEADWVGQLLAIIIILTAIGIAKRIKR